MSPECEEKLAKTRPLTENESRLSACCEQLISQLRARVPHTQDLDEFEQAAIADYAQLAHELTTAPAASVPPTQGVNAGFPSVQQLQRFERASMTMLDTFISVCIAVAIAASALAVTLKFTLWLFA